MEDMTREKLGELGNQWLRMQFVTREQHFGKLFSEIPIIYYITLLSLRERLGMGKEKEKLYLKEICQEMDLPMTRVSKMTQGMQEKGYVYWKHEDSGRPGTYITLSELGESALQRQQKKITDFFEKAIDKYGVERFTQLIELRKDFNDTMEAVLAEEE